MNKLRFLKIACRIQAKEGYSSTGFIGNKVRGAIGEAMVHLFCPNKKPQCHECGMKEQCIYSNVFKPVRTHVEFTSLPAPFVIGVEELVREDIMSGDIVEFSVTLFGKMIVYRKQLIQTLQSMFCGKRRGFSKAFTLLEINSIPDGKLVWREEIYNIDAGAEAVLWQDCFNRNVGCTGENREIMIRFKTDLITKNDIHVNWGFSEFLDAVLYRIAGMIDIYEEDEFILPYGMLYRKPYIISDIFVDSGRFEMIFSGNMEPYLPYIQLGEYLHIGKKTTYGFGEYSCFILK